MTRPPLAHNSGLAYSPMTKQWRYRFDDKAGTVLCCESLDDMRQQLDLREAIGHEAWLQTLIAKQQTFQRNGSGPPAV